MTLDAYLKTGKITNEQFAKMLRRRHCKATLGWVSRIRRGEAPSRKLALAIQALTGGEVTAAELLKLKAPAVPAAPSEAA